MVGPAFQPDSETRSGGRPIGYNSERFHARGGWTVLQLATKFAPTAALFEQALRAGFHAAEVWLSEKHLADAAGVVRLARHYPLRLAVHCPNRIDQPATSLPALVRLARELLPSCVVIHQDLHDAHARALLDLEPGLPLGVENGALSPAGFQRWAEVNPGLTLDVEHLWKYTLSDGPLTAVLETVADFLERFGRKLRHIHLPGYWPGMAEHRPMYCGREFVFPVLELLQDAGFAGLIVSEVGLMFQTANDLRMDVLLFETWRSKYDPFAEPSSGRTDPEVVI
jgi:sugar phosphate isomerase/epimerase